MRMVAVPLSLSALNRSTKEPFQQHASECAGNRFPWAWLRIGSPCLQPLTEPERNNFPPRVTWRIDLIWSSDSMRSSPLNRDTVRWTSSVSANAA